MHHSPPKTKRSVLFLCQSTQLPRISQNYPLSASTVLWLLLQKKKKKSYCYSLYSFTAPDFRVVVCPATPDLLLGLRKVINFQIVQYFSCCEDGRDAFQALSMADLKLEIQDCFSTNGTGAIGHPPETKKNLDLYFALHQFKKLTQSGLQTST